MLKTDQPRCFLPLDSLDMISKLSKAWLSSQTESPIAFCLDLSALKGGRVLTPEADNFQKPFSDGLQTWSFFDFVTATFWCSVLTKSPIGITTHNKRPNKLRSSRSLQMILGGVTTTAGPPFWLRYAAKLLMSNGICDLVELLWTQAWKDRFCKHGFCKLCFHG